MTDNASAAAADEAGGGTVTVGKVAITVGPAVDPAGDAGDAPAVVVEGALLALQGGGNFDVPGIAPSGHFSHSLWMQAGT